MIKILNPETKASDLELHTIYVDYDYSAPKATYTEFFSYRRLLEESLISAEIWLDCGDYAGDILAIVRDERRKKVGFVVIGYGSCSGCDALQDCEKPQDFYELLKSIMASIIWAGSYEDLAEKLESLDEANHWWLNDDDCKAGFGRIMGYLRS